jgi:hypothetical protein
MAEGRITYVPKNVLDELEDIMREKEIRKKSKGFDEMTRFAKVGREAERIFRLRF